MNKHQIHQTINDLKSFIGGLMINHKIDIRDEDGTEIVDVINKLQAYHDALGMDNYDCPLCIFENRSGCVFGVRS